uniref:Uncharacterized protein n=1 Tax=Arundo donax TaxID=35708 RepID=A0A0A9GQ16_ARUDO
MVPNHLPSQPSFYNLQKRPLDVVSRKNFSQHITLIQENSRTDHQLPNTQLLSNDKRNQGRKKLCLQSKKLSLKSELPDMDRTCDKESRLPDCSQSDDRKSPHELPLSAPVLKSETTAPGFAGSQKDARPGNAPSNKTQPLWRT